MPIIKGLIDPAGTILRSSGTFTFISKGNNTLIIEIPGANLSTAFVLATPWRHDEDIGSNAYVAASPVRSNVSRMKFALPDNYGLSFQIET